MFKTFNPPDLVRDPFKSFRIWRSSTFTVQINTAVSSIDLQQSLGIAEKDRLFLSAGTVESFDLLGRLPVAQLIRIVGSHHNVICSDHTSQIVHGFYPV